MVFLDLADFVSRNTLHACGCCWWWLESKNLRNEKYWILSRHKFLVRPSQFARPGIRRDNNIYINKTERTKVAQTDGFQHFECFQEIFLDGFKIGEVASEALMK